MWSHLLQLRRLPHLRYEPSWKKSERREVFAFNLPHRELHTWAEPRPLRSYDNHQAVSKDADPHQEIRQRQSELQYSNSSLIVVVSVKQKGVFTVSLLMKQQKKNNI